MDRDRILRIVKDTLKLDNLPLAEDSQETLAKWDSLSHLHLVMTLEREFNVKFPMTVIPDLTSIKVIESELQKCTKN